MNFASTHHPVEVVTLDQDATLAETHKNRLCIAIRNTKLISL